MAAVAARSVFTAPTDTAFLPYGRQSIDEEDIAAVLAVLRGDFITQGPTIERFEAEIAKMSGARFAVAVTSGTAALHIACLAAGLKPGRRGVTVPITFVASYNAMLYCGADADLVDVDPDHLCMSPAALAEYLKTHPDCEVIIPVHFAGLSAQGAELRKIAGKRIIIEDASHSFGGTYESGRPIGCGDHADMTVFSFHPVKPITTGEGGAVVTNDPELARRLRMFRNHGLERDPDRFINREAGFDGNVPQPWYYEAQELGFNYRMTDIQAALGASQLRRLDHFVARRRDIAKTYDRALSGLRFMVPAQSHAGQRNRSGLHLYVGLFDFAGMGLSRRQVMEKLRETGVGSQVHYIPVHLHPAYHERLGGQSFPIAEAYYQRCLSLPLHPSLTDRDVARVIDSVRALAA